MFPSTLPKTCFLICFCLFFCAEIVGQAQFWRPVTPEELQAKAPVVEADADAEALLWEVYVDDQDTGGTLQTVLTHYVKVKIFSERGREAFSKIDIHFGRIEGLDADIRIRDIAARTTKLDGTVVELKDSDIFEKDIELGPKTSLKAKSFVVPGVEVGAIIEYRWREIRGVVTYHQRLYFARDIPVRLVKYHIKPVDHPELGMGGQPFNIVNTPFVKESNGFWITTAANVPSFKPEPLMPPEYSIRPWLLLYYTKNVKIEPEKYWKQYGRKAFDEHKPMTKVSDEVRRAAHEATLAETAAEKKIEKIVHYVRAKIKDINEDANKFSAEDRKNFRPNKDAAETLTRGLGTAHDINMAFAAMAAATGMDARIVNLPRRSDVVFPKWFTDDYFMRTECVAINFEGTWKYFDPASRYAPFGMLRWQGEGQPALISDAREPIWTTTPLSPASRSMRKRAATMRLLADGTLEGNVRIEYTGHIGAYYKEFNDDRSQHQQEAALRSMIKSDVLSSAEISDISVENINDPDKPLVYSFKLSVPGYASRTDKRIFLQPNIFERSTKPLFSESSRRYDIYFQFPYSERDQVAIELPPGFELENPDAPQMVKDSSGIGVNQLTLYIGKDKKSLTYVRNFAFGNGGVLAFDKSAYAQLKTLFDAFYKANAHEITLKQSAPALPAN